MTAYTPKLDSLLTAYADHLERQVKILIDPKAGLARTLTAAFASKSKSDKFVTGICRELGWNDYESWNADTGITGKLTQIADMAAQNGNFAASAKIRRAMAVFDAIDRTVSERTGVINGLRQIKKLKLVF